MKIVYKKMEIDCMAVRLESGILTGSLTNQSIKVNTVTVDEYDAGFDIGLEHNDFQDLSFD